MPRLFNIFKDAFTRTTLENARVVSEQQRRNNKQIYPKNVFFEEIDTMGYKINVIQDSINASLVGVSGDSLTNDIKNKMSTEDLLRKHSHTIEQIKESLTNAKIQFNDYQVLDAIRYIALNLEGGKRRSRRARKAKTSKRSKKANKRGTRRS
jgi:hypothetical protein